MARRWIRFICGDALRELKRLETESVQCCVTSPPYWGLRDYKLPSVTWGGDPKCSHRFEEKSLQPGGSGNGKSFGGKVYLKRGAHQLGFCKCGAWKGSLGLEPSFDFYIEHLVEIFREVRRILRKDGTLWLNIGDSYVTSPAGNKPNTTKDASGLLNTRENLEMRRSVQSKKKDYKRLKFKNLCGIPWRLAFALQDDGWVLRSDIIWAKPNPMPESVTDRPTKAHEYVFLLTKQVKYFYSADAIKEPVSDSFRKNYAPGKGTHNVHDMTGRLKRNEGFEAYSKGKKTCLTRNKRTIWFIAPQPFKGAHFATFPTNLVKPCILAGTMKGQLVLDPFAGAGTVALVCKRLGRRSVNIELSQEYVDMAIKRIHNG